MSEPKEQPVREQSQCGFEVTAARCLKRLGHDGLHELAVTFEPAPSAQRVATEKEQGMNRLQAMKQNARPDVVQIAQDALDDCNNAGHPPTAVCWPCLFALVESLVPERALRPPSQEHAEPQSAEGEPEAAALRSRGDKLAEAVGRAEHKLSAYVGVCKDDKELTDTVLPMCRAALAAWRGAGQDGEVSSKHTQDCMFPESTNPKHKCGASR